MFIETIDRDELLTLCGQDVNPDVSFLATIDLSNLSQRRYLAAGRDGQTHARIEAAIRYMDDLLLRVEHHHPRARGSDVRRFLFQADDCPRNANSVSWERLGDWSAVTLVPDLYYFGAGGYHDFMATDDLCPSWSERQPALVWRGATTGLLALTPAKLPILPRYQLCLAAQALGEAADVGFTDIVQAVSDEDHAAITRDLLANDAMKPYLPFDQMAGYKYVVDIDGNANSWNFMKKLRLGACVLKVLSPWRQWFTDQLVEWRHYVPVAGDASDLAEKVDWCRTHDAQAREIAANGRSFALEMDFEVEMREAAKRVLDALASSAT